jgi:uncharacterized protein
MLVVLDTNVLVSGLLNPFGAPASVIALLVGGKITAAYDSRILNEYQTVLSRTAFSFTKTDVMELIDLIKNEGYLVVAEPCHLPAVPEHDRPFAEAGATAGAEYLITGNLKHFPAKIGPMKVISPARFIELR